ncbi:MAG: NUDIX domain-containing protein [Breznakibacter sp.]
MIQPSSVFKYCPRCGSRAFEFDNDRSFKCQDCRFHFFINSSAAVAGIIVNDKGEILFSVRAFDPDKGMLDLPGGFVDPLESAEQAVIREIKEELGLDVVAMRYIGSWYNEYKFSGLSVYTTDLGFVVDVASLEGIAANDDISGFEFTAPGMIDYSRIGAESIRRLVKMYLSQYPIL